LSLSHQDSGPRAWYSFSEFGLVFAALLAYTCAFFLWFPAGPGIRDEAKYLRQATCFADGHIHVDTLSPEGSTYKARPADKPPGTAALMAPLVQLGGPSAAFLLSLLCLWLAVGFTGLLLRNLGHSPVWSMVILCYPPSLVLGRAAMSDVPSMAFAAIGLWAFFSGMGTCRTRSLLAGFIAGLSLLLRETNVLVFIPLFLGSLIRRDRTVIWLVLGGLVGTAIRMWAVSLVFGDPINMRETGFIYGFGISALGDNLLIYSAALLIMVPGGLWFALRYRGSRHPEVIATVVVVLLFFTFYEYSGSESSGVTRLIVTPRFLLSILPLLALAMAETVPRSFPGLWKMVRRPMPGLPVRVLGGIVVAGILTAVIAVHPVHASWANKRLKIRHLIEQTVPADSCIVGTKGVIPQYVDDLGRSVSLDPRTANGRDEALQAIAAELPRTCPRIILVVLQRTDSPFWRQISDQNLEMVALLKQRCVLREIANEQVNAHNQVIMFELTECR